MSAVGDRARRKLHERLEEVLGDEAADTLMSEIHSLGREQLATRHDLQMLRAELKTDIAEFRADMKGEFATFGIDMAKQTRQLGIWMLASQTTLVGMVFAAVRL